MQRVEPRTQQLYKYTLPNGNLEFNLSKTRSSGCSYSSRALLLWAYLGPRWQFGKRQRNMQIEQLMLEPAPCARAKTIFMIHRGIEVVWQP